MTRYALIDECTIHVITSGPIEVGGPEPAWETACGMGTKGEMAVILPAGAITDEPDPAYDWCVGCLPLIDPDEPDVDPPVTWGEALGIDEGPAFHAPPEDPA